MIKNSIYGLCLLIVLSACSTQPTTKPSPITGGVFDDHLDSSFLFEQAQTNWQRWLEFGDNTALNRASNYYKRGLALRPDDAGFQRGYYLALFSQVSQYKASHTDLMQAFNRMAPAIQKTVAAPARLLYVQAVEQKQGTDIQEMHIKQGLEQQPFDDYLWFSYSKLMSSKNQHRLAAAYAKKAYDLDDTRAYYHYQLAVALNEMAFDSSCVYEQKPILKQSLKYLLGAAKLQPEEQHYAERVSLQYGRLQLFPLALIYAQKAYELDPNRLNTYRYMFALFYMKKYEAAQDLVQELADSMQKYWGHSALVEILLAQGDVDGAAKHAQILLDNSEASGIDQIAWQWLALLSDDTYQAPAIRSNEELTDAWADFLNQGGQQPPAVDSSACSNSSKHFVLAYKHWQQGQLEQAIGQLKQLKQSGRVFSTEYNIATALLNSRILL